ncbi:MAG: MBOAT family protein [Muribaculaceae bacterium]|nr:MBOAT family protein [Muribaculaceae bacterium]
MNHLLSLFTFNSEEPMLFASGLFWALFLVFLPLYAMLKSQRKKMMLFVIAFGLFFFYKSSGWFFLLLVATSFIDWWLAQFIDSSKNRTERRVALTISLVLSLSVLLFFKYSNFVMSNLEALIGGNFQPLDLIMPVGISFYTFRTISYVVDVYKGKIQPTDDYIDYLFFLSYFPCLVAGPIVRAKDFMPQLQENKPATREMIYGGLWLVMLGILKKAVFADYIAQYNSIAFGNPTGYTGFELLMAVLGFTMQIYCDFSGYSDMAIGIGSIMGFNLGINFDYPYRSLNVTEFWRRWHITLSFWLRDYVYIPLGGNRKGKVRQHINLMVTMLLGGLWHGAAWTFVVWGAGHGIALCVHKICKPWLDGIESRPVTRFFSWLLTFSFVAFLWIFFRASTFEAAGQVISGIFTDFEWAYLPVFIERRLTWCIMLAIIFGLHFVPRRIWDKMRDWFINVHWVVKLVIFIVLIQLVLQFASATVQPFLYSQF